MKAASPSLPLAVHVGRTHYDVPVCLPACLTACLPIYLFVCLLFYRRVQQLTRYRSKERSGECEGVVGWGRVRSPGCLLKLSGLSATSAVRKLFMGCVEYQMHWEQPLHSHSHLHSQGHQMLVLVLVLKLVLRPLSMMVVTSGLHHLMD